MFSHFFCRQQSLLSDEQAKEVEQILSAAPTVGVAVAAVVATATSPTHIKNLIEEGKTQTPSPPAATATADKCQASDVSHHNAAIVVDNDNDDEGGEDEEEPEEDDDDEDSPDEQEYTLERIAEDTAEQESEQRDSYLFENVTTNQQHHHQGIVNRSDNHTVDVRHRSSSSIGASDDVDKYADDDDDIEDVDIVGIGATSEGINNTFTVSSENNSSKQETVAIVKTSSSSFSSSSSSCTTQYSQIRANDDDEPEWLRDVLEAPKRSLENLLISSIQSHNSGNNDKHSQQHSVEAVPSPPDTTSVTCSSSSSSIFAANDVVLVTTASKVETTYDEANDSTTIYIAAANQAEHQRYHTQQQQQQQQQHQSFECHDQESLLNRSFIQDSTANSTSTLHGHSTAESLHESIVSVESTQSDATFNNQTTTIDDSIISSKHNSTYSLNEPQSLNTTNTSVAPTELDESQYYIPEYPPVRSKEVYVESGVHYFEDGNFWMEVPGKFAHFLSGLEQTRF